MRFLHISDLHIGKRLNGISLAEDQKHIFNQIIEIIKSNNLGAVVIAGDVYDKSTPAAEAVELFDDFLTALCELDIPILIISGNHDSPERLGFGGRIMENRNIHIYSVFDGTLRCVTIDDVDFYMLPFVKPQTVRNFYNDDELRDYNKMAELIFADFKKKRKSVLVIHQFITSSSSDEGVNVGSLDNIDVSYFKEFDYIAMGHIHTPQTIKNSKAVYCGSPLKYSFSESDDRYALIVDTDDMSTEKVPLTPLRDMRKIKGEIEELLKPEVYEGTNTEDFLHVTLTDDKNITDAIGRLRAVYKNVLEIEFLSNIKKEADLNISVSEIQSKTPLELFCDFFEEQNGKKMTEDQENIIKELMEAEK